MRRLRVLCPKLIQTLEELRDDLKEEIMNRFDDGYSSANDKDEKEQLDTPKARANWAADSTRGGKAKGKNRGKGGGKRQAEDLDDRHGNESRSRSRTPSPVKKSKKDKGAKAAKQWD